MSYTKQVTTKKMTTPEDEGGMCLKCGDLNFGENHDEHIRLHNLKKGDKIKVTLNEHETNTEIVATAEIIGEFEQHEDHPQGGYWSKFLKVTEDGEDVTEKYKKVLGEERGIPHSKMKEDVELVTEE